MVFISCCLPPLAAASGTFVISPPEGKNYVACEGTYSGHLQGVVTNGADAIYWSFTTAVVKTTRDGKVLKKTKAIDHHGDLTFADGKVYVAVNDRTSENPGEFNRPNPNNPARQWIYEYDADLNYLARHAIPQVVYGAGGMAWHKGRFWVVGGLPGPLVSKDFGPEKFSKNYLYEYDASFRLVKVHELATGNTELGIQTVEFGAGRWWFGTYETAPRRGSGQKAKKWLRQAFSCDEKLVPFTQFGFHSEQPEGAYPEASLGIAALPGGYFLVGGGSGAAGKRRGYVWMATANDAGRLVILDKIPAK